MHNSEDSQCSEDFSKPFDWTDCPPGPEWIADSLAVLRFMQKIRSEDKKIEKVENQEMEQNLCRSFKSNCKL